MTLAILGLGTALPGTPIDQAESVAITKAVCCQTAEQAALLPVFYRQTGITTRHLAVDRAVVEDVLKGTALSGSFFLPHPERPHGPTTRQRMAHYGREAGPLAAQAAQSALEKSALTATAAGTSICGR